MRLEFDSPKFCPYCGHATIRDSCPVWHATSLEEPDNDAELQEYQCTGECEGRSFWA
jgi:hypothetical protein